MASDLHSLRDKHTTGGMCANLIADDEASRPRAPTPNQPFWPVTLAALAVKVSRTSVMSDGQVLEAFQ